MFRREELSKAGLNIVLNQIGGGCENEGCVPDSDCQLAQAWLGLINSGAFDGENTSIADGTAVEQFDVLCPGERYIAVNVAVWSWAIGAGHIALDDIQDWFNLVR